jgi:hypothetical protein
MRSYTQPLRQRADHGMGAAGIFLGLGLLGIVWFVGVSVLEYIHFEKERRAGRVYIAEETAPDLRQTREPVRYRLTY